MTTLALAAAALTMAAPGLASTLGSHLFNPPNAGICPTAPPAPEASCTETQLQLAGLATDELLAPHHGVITSWKVSSGPASPATAGVQLRLRLLRGGEAVPGAEGDFVTLPLADPGIHRFPARLPIDPGEELGLDVAVLAAGGGIGSAPIAHSGPSLGEVGEWMPPLGAEPRTSERYLRETELLLGARIEPDPDRDGYGDRTQDRCPYDPRRHSPCLPDSGRPGLEVTSPGRQNFLRTRKVRLRVRPSEFSQVIASAQLEVPTATWGIYGARAWVRQGSAALVLKIPARADRAGKAALDRGGRVFVKVFVTVIDASGNRTHETVRITPKSL